jgi:hypothetical protein
MSNSKNKHVNIRITNTVDKQIESIKGEMEKREGMNFSRSQVIFMLIMRGIEKYTENQLNGK